MELSGFLERVAECNSPATALAAFLPLVVDGAAVGLLTPAFAEQLCTAFPAVFERAGASAVTLAAGLPTPQARTDAVGACMLALRDAGHVPGWRDELFPVAPAFGAAPSFLLERACAARFGIRAYGVHVNCFTRAPDGSVDVWVARRAADKPTFPGMLDHAVAGGLGAGLTPSENVVKECGEEAAVPPELAARAQPAGCVSYAAVVPDGCKRDVLFCYDLELPPSFVPANTDGEVAEFFRMPLREVAELVRTSRQYKPNCNLVIIDFLIRHGLITPDSPGYLSLVGALRSGDVV